MLFIQLREQLLGETGTVGTWAFGVRFLTHEQLGEFQDHCSNVHIPPRSRTHLQLRPSGSRDVVRGDETSARSAHASCPRGILFNLATNVHAGLDRRVRYLRSGRHRMTAPCNRDTHQNTPVIMQEEREEESEQPPDA